MEQLTKNQAVATSQEAVQNQNEPQLRDENAHNDKSVHGVLNPTYQAGLRRDAVQPDIEAELLPTVNTTGYIDHAAFLGTINPDTNKIPKHLFQGYLNIYNNYFKAPWMPDRTEANPNELNQDDARYGFRCCHLK